MKKFNFVIVGAGIIGLATAQELIKRFPQASIVILEKEEGVGKHASGRNSGVLHSGIYYGSSTLKAKVCAAGSARMHEFAMQHDIPLNRCGKLIIATKEDDLPIIDRLLRNAKENNIAAAQVNESQIKEMEPYASPHKTGIFCPNTSVIDSKAVIAKLCKLLAKRGVQLEFRTAVIDIVPAKHIVHCMDQVFEYDYLFNCAGAYADVIAKKFGLAQNYRLIPFKGIYYKLAYERSHLVKSNIYPVPDINLPFLGVHLTRSTNEDVYVGPTAIPALGREHYGMLQGINLAESLPIAAQLLKMYSLNKHHFRKLVHTEMRKYVKPYFLAAAQRLVPNITSADLLPCNKVGIRPQLINLKKGTLEMDYVIERTASSTHVLNAISPAFTSAFAFAELLVAESGCEEINKSAIMNA